MILVSGLISTPICRTSNKAVKQMDLQKVFLKGTLLYANDRACESTKGTVEHRKTVVELMLIAVLAKNVKLWKEWKQGYANRENYLKVKKKGYKSCLRG